MQRINEVFKEITNGCVGFDSSWKEEKEAINQGCQTTEFKTRDQPTNTASSTSIQTQTEENLSDINDIIESVDMDKLAKFLNGAYPDMMHELKDCSVSNALASLKLEDDENELVISAKMLQQITVVEEIEKKESQKDGIYASGISWNSTGNTLAVSFSYYHKSWCHHQGLVYLYTFDRDNKLPANPTKKLYCESCVTSISFHPVQPSTLCAGTFSGEIYLWNSQNDEKDNLIAMVADHDDRVSLVKWVLNIDTKKSVSALATSSRDGYIFLWEVSVEDIMLNVKQRFTPGKIGKSISNPEVYLRKSESGGITHFDFSPHISGLFVLGMEGGTLIKCSILGAKPLLNDADIFDPSVLNYEGHEGDLISIKFAPHRKDIFLTCGTDNEIKIFNIDQTTPTQIIFMDSELECISWVPHGEKLLVGCGANGRIRLFSLLNGQPIPNAHSVNKSDFSKLAINKKRIDLIAFANRDGQVQLWSMPWNSIAAQDYKNVYVNKDNY